MNEAWHWALAISLAGSPLLAQAPAPACGITRRAILSDSGIGALRIGRRIADVGAECRILSDTTTDNGEDGPVRTLVVQISSMSVAAVVDSDRVQHIEVASIGLRTQEGFGPGTLLSRLLQGPGIRGFRGAELELAAYVVVPSHCGMSFRVPWPAADDHSPAELDAAELAAFPEDSRVSEVLIFGCEH